MPWQFQSNPKRQLYGAPALKPGFKCFKEIFSLKHTGFMRRCVNPSKRKRVVCRITLELPGHSILTSHLRQTTDNYKLSTVYTQLNIYETDMQTCNFPLTNGYANIRIEKII